MGGFVEISDIASGVSVGSALVARRAFHIMKWLNLAPRIIVKRAKRRIHFVILPTTAGIPNVEESLILACGAGYLRGIFLVRGYLADPERSVHVELWLKDERQRQFLWRVLAPLRIHPKLAFRRGRMIAYLKDRQQVGQLLAHMGAHQAVLTMESTQVLKTMKNRVNRLVNSETANLRRAVESGLDQAQTLQQILGENPVLPPPLHELAMLRVAHPDWSLKELGVAMHPPLSKSAVNHRMRRLLQGHIGNQYR
jgi:DNA-binding protein WhiA